MAEPLRSLQRVLADELLVDGRVVGVGAGPRHTGGRPTGEPCVRFYVERKLPPEALPAGDRLPARVGGFATDVIEIGRLCAIPATTGGLRGRRRPVRPGCSVGHDAPMAGTLGAVARDKDGALHLVSCNHVLADENRAPLGAAIFQPAILDGGSPRTDQVARLERFVPLDPAQPNRVDCALARALNRYAVDGSLLPHGRLLRLPPGVAARGMRVYKGGRTTGRTTGRVLDAAADLKVWYASGILRFSDQVLIESSGAPFSAPGDSGSLIVDEDSGRPVALLFAGSPSHTVANPIGAVLAALDVELVA